MRKIYTLLKFYKIIYVLTIRLKKHSNTERYIILYDVSQSYSHTVRFRYNLKNFSPLYIHNIIIQSYLQLLMVKDQIFMLFILSVYKTAQ